MNEKQAQLEWEARAGKIAGAFAFLAGALIVLGIAYRVSAVPHGADDVAEFLPLVNKNEGTFLMSGILSGLAMLSLIPPLYYLYRVTRYRRPELQPIALVLLFLGPIVFAAVQVLFQIEQADAAQKFVDGTNKSVDHAEDLLRDATSLMAGLSLAASVAIGFATILISLNAMRAGVLSRFMGILGILLGGLFVLPLIAAPIIQLFWVTALAILFLNQWPGTGRGPAWETGEADPWPTAQDRYAEQQAAANPGEPQLEDSEPDGSEPDEPATRTRSRKRKKKRR